MSRARTTSHSRRCLLLPPPPEPAPTEPLPPAEGRWTFTVSSTDDQGLAVDDDAALRRQLDARLAPRLAGTRGR